MDYITQKVPSISEVEGSQGETMFGCLCIAGNLLILLSHVFKLKYSIIGAQSVTALGYGATILLVSVAPNKFGFISRGASARAGCLIVI